MARNAYAHTWNRLWHGPVNARGKIIFADGYYRSGERPVANRALAELYAIEQLTDHPLAWTLVAQEILSRTPLWPERYYRDWADTLRIGLVVDDLPLLAGWQLVVYTPQASIACRVLYTPQFGRRGVERVSYRRIDKGL